jgi:hypothetical protein
MPYSNLIIKYGIVLVLILKISCKINHKILNKLLHLKTIKNIQYEK